MKIIETMEKLGPDDFFLGQKVLQRPRAFETTCRRLQNSAPLEEWSPEILRSSDCGTGVLKNGEKQLVNLVN